MEASLEQKLQAASTKTAVGVLWRALGNPETLKPSKGAGGRAQDVRKAVLPVLLRLLGEEGVRERVPQLLARLLQDHPHLQAAAADADVVSKLAAFLHRDACSAQLKVGGAEPLTMSRGS